MIKQSLFSVALALATATVSAQAPKSTKPAQPKSAAVKPATPSQTQTAASGYVPAIMQPRLTLTGCLQHDQDYTLTKATVSQQGDVAQGEPKAPAAAAYKLEGISPARLSLLIGKRVQVNGAFLGEGKPAAKSLPRFEATAIQEATGSCP